MTNEATQILADLSNNLTPGTIHAWCESDIDFEIRTKRASSRQSTTRIQIKLPTVHSENVNQPKKSITLFAPKPAKPQLGINTKISTELSRKHITIRSPQNLNNYHSLRRNSSTPRHKMFLNSSRERLPKQPSNDRNSLIKKVWLLPPSKPGIPAKSKDISIPSYCYLPPTHLHVPRSSSESKRRCSKENLKFSRKELEDSFTRKFEKYSNLIHSLDTSTNIQFVLNRFMKNTTVLNESTSKLY
jgi:hypothetical protein